MTWTNQDNDRMERLLEYAYDREDDDAAALLTEVWVIARTVVDVVHNAEL